MPMLQCLSKGALSYVNLWRRIQVKVDDLRDLNTDSFQELDNGCIVGSRGMLQIGGLVPVLWQ